MKKEILAELFNKLEDSRNLQDGIEFWSARDLQNIFAYTDWRNFIKVIEKAEKSCKTAEISIEDNFLKSKRFIDLGNNSQREVEDFVLTRYACYLIAQNGDPSKAEIAYAQAYFAVQTRKQEIIEQRLLEMDRVNARSKLSKSEKKLSGIIYERGVDERGFALIRSEGDRALFGGYSTSEMKRKLQVPEKRPIADFLPTLTIKAKDFATELTSHNVLEKDLTGQNQISNEHIENNQAVRKMLIERGVRPEKLPPAEDIKKVSRKLETEKKKLIKSSKHID